jgi:hypothetical protein
MNADESIRLHRLEQQVAFLYQHLGLDPSMTFSSPADVFGTPTGYGDGQTPPVPVAGLVPGPNDCPPAVMAAIQQGKLIVAIKIYRELTGLGLREAKEAVDGWSNQVKSGWR